jgi:DNA-binding NarL/FixJ family response regulator
MKPVQKAKKGIKREVNRKPQLRRAKDSHSPKNQIFIVEDHPAFREGLVQILNREPDLCVCGSAKNAEEAPLLIASLKPALVLVDLSLPGKSGLELIRELRVTDREIKILVISMHDEALYADRVLRAGGDGYIMKQEDPEEIIHAIRDVLAGHIYVSEEVLASREKLKVGATRAKGRPLDELTDSELELLELLGRGKPNQEIARLLNLTPRAVSTQSARIRAKLRLERTEELIRYAVCWVETGAA